jgi:hypothetical protein
MTFHGFLEFFIEKRRVDSFLERQNTKTLKISSKSTDVKIHSHLPFYQVLTHNKYRHYSKWRIFNFNLF